MKKKWTIKSQFGGKSLLLLSMYLPFFSGKYLVLLASSRDHNNAVRAAKGVGAIKAESKVYGELFVANLRKYQEQL